MRTGADVERIERRAMIALLAAFVLIVQALWPTAAMAASPDFGSAAMICTGSGLAAPPTGDLAPYNAGGPMCPDCVCPPLAAEPPSLAMTSAPVRYADAARPYRVASSWVAPPTRAPPRPPGQGPPASNA